MNKTDSLCITQSRKHDRKWIVGTLLVALLCFSAGLFLLADRPLSWINITLFFMGLAALIKLGFNLRNFLHPEKGTLGKSLRPYLEESGETDVFALFRRIDKDMEEHGTQFDSVWVGREWVLGEEAMRIDRIRGIFSIKMKTGSQPECDIYLVDDRRQVQITSLASERALNWVYSHLTRLLPGAACGNFRDYVSFVSKSDEEMALFNALFLAGETREKTQFILQVSDDLPTSLVTSELIRATIDRLLPEEQVILTPCIPWKSPWGNSTGLGVRRIENDKFCLIAYFKDREHSIYISPFVSREEAGKALIAYFEKYEVPNPSDWNDQSFLLNQDHSMEKYVLYVDERPYEYITYDDVMASWDDLNEGKCTTIMLHTPTCQNGYMQVSGSADNYTVEVVGLDRTDQVCGYRTHTRYGGHVTHWLYNYYHEYKFPEFRDDWVNITEELRNFIAAHKQEQK